MIPLQADRQVVIGRGSDQDLVLAEEEVSRRHARLTVGAHGIVIEDLGSTNGTFVNGERIKAARLSVGDRLLVGTSILKLVRHTPGAERTLAEAAAAQTRRSTSMSGRIEEIPLPDLLQLLHTSKKSGVLAVHASREGRIHFSDGKVRHAWIEGEPGISARKAFTRMVTWQEGTFELRPEDPAAPQTLNLALEALLMDAIRQLDEYRRVAKELPPETARLTLATPLRPPLRALTPEQLDVLQLVLNRGTLRAVLDASEREDAEVASVVLSLVRGDYLRAS